jgi:penicillin-binding protein 1A
MKSILKNSPVEDFPIPEGIVFANIDSETGLLATFQSKKTEELPFIKGTAPAEYSIDSMLNYQEKLFKLDLEDEEALIP